MPNIQPIQPKFHLAVLNAEQRQAIKSATLHTLEQVGVRFPSQRALRVFAEHGARVDWESEIVRLPPELVTEAMSHAPRSYTLSGRAEGADNEHPADLLLDGTSSYFGTDGCGTLTIDFETGEQRHSCKEDVAKMARVADYLPVAGHSGCGGAGVGYLVLFHATKIDFPSSPRPRLKPSGSAYKGLSACQI